MYSISIYLKLTSTVKIGSHVLLHQEDNDFRAAFKRFPVPDAFWSMVQPRTSWQSAEDSYHSIPIRRFP